MTYAYIMKRIVALLTTVALMTMPSSLQVSLPGQITAQETSPLVSRIGTVVDIVDAQNVTVQISGSPVLVTASFLFPAYEPLIGDLVYVTREDSQWMVHGTMSGEVNSLAENPSFESGTIGATPDSWTFVPAVTTAGTMTMTKELAGAMHGRYVARFRTASAGVAGTSSGNAVSSLVPVDDPFTRWGVGYFVTYAVPDVNASLEPQGGHIFLESFVQWFDGSSTFIGEDSMYFLPIYSGISSPIYVRTSTTASADPYVLPPAAAVYARFKLSVTFTLHTNCVSEVGIDLAYLRGVTP